MSQTIITAGFMPLTDSALLIIAHEKGFAAAEGIELHLMRETSWANIRDRVGVGHFDVAHMLAPMPVAANLGLSPLPARFVAPMTLGHGGNAITVSLALWSAMLAQGAQDDLDPASTSRALAEVVKRPGKRIRFGVVHLTSSHNYELRYWLAAGGIVPDRDVEIVVLPPPLLPDALASGAIDGYCVGEPWGGVAALAGTGRIATAKARIWRSSPDKVLGMCESWAEQNPETLAALIRTLHRAAVWCSVAENLAEVAQMMALPQYLDHPAELIAGALTGMLAIGSGVTDQVDGFYEPYQREANFAWKSQALWFYAQMVRWGHVRYSPDNTATAAAAFRPDLYREALAPLGVALPEQDYKIEDGFFDGVAFDWKRPFQA